MVREINIKENMPTVAEALEILKSSVATAKSDRVKVLEIIHGYGSTGVGGAICVKTRQWLRAQVGKGKLKSVIEGENFSMFDEKSRQLHAKYNELSKYYNKGNNGITIIEL